MGQMQSRARAFIVDAINFAAAGQFNEARARVLRAVELNGAYRTNPDVQSLYELIVAHSATSAEAELRRIRDASNQWPLPLFEAIRQGWIYRLLWSLLFAFIAFAVIRRCMGLDI